MVKQAFTGIRRWTFVFIGTVMVMLTVSTSSAQTGAQPAGPLNFASRVACQWRIEEVYWRHRLWPEQNPGPKPPLADVLPAEAVQAKVADTLRKTQALETYWQQPISGEMLQAEIDRMARNTRQPQVLAELWQALGNDPHLIAECLARPVLADRLIRNFYQGDARFREASFDAWWQGVKQSFSASLDEPAFSYRLPVIAPDLPLDYAWSATQALPEGTVLNTAVWTGAEMIIWGGTNSALNKFNTGARYNPATDTWSGMTTVGAPMPRKQHSAVWTGIEMIVWGGCGLLPEHMCQINSGARYNPMTEMWTAVSLVNAPSARMNHTAVWTGTEMIIWGGCRFQNDVCRPSALGNSGGRYNPTNDQWTPTSLTNAPDARMFHSAVWTDTWQPTSTTNAPSARTNHTAVWTGTEMIVWGGSGQNTGSRYNPTTDTWQPISLNNAPTGRSAHTAVWTGSEMIVWGGSTNSGPTNSGGRYNPTMDTWQPTSTLNAPAARSGHRAVWTGSLMVVWGGGSKTGGRYNPATDTWAPTNSQDPGTSRAYHTAVWTGTEMIAWGGEDAILGTFYGSGVRYDPVVATWTPTNLAGAPGGRIFHTAIWTGVEMIVWGGQDGPYVYSDGGRYNPMTDQWTPVSTVNAPAGRANHTAVWTGTEMIIWGGSGTTTGGRYNPNTNSWTPTTTAGAPPGRYIHTAVWTGSEMIIWGGIAATGDTNTGGRYNPATDTWQLTSTTNAPSARHYQSAVWTGSRMLIWGGMSGSFNGGTFYNTGGLYDPATNTWQAISTINAPVGRVRHSTVWTGSQMIVWGGCTSTAGGSCAGEVYTGGHYDPATDTWQPTSLSGVVPGGRSLHSGVWTGDEMIVWGGFVGDNSTYTTTGGHYRPVTPPTPTPTPGPSQTPSPGPSPTPTATRTNTPTRTPTPTVTPPAEFRLFLPLVLKQNTPP